MHVYRWLQNTFARNISDAKHLKSLPEIKSKPEWTKKIHPGKCACRTRVAKPNAV